MSADERQEKEAVALRNMTHLFHTHTKWLREVQKEQLALLLKEKHEI